MDSAKAVLVIVFSSSLLEIPLFRFCQDYCSSTSSLGGKSGLASQQCSWILTARGWNPSRQWLSESLAACLVSKVPWRIHSCHSSNFQDGEVLIGYTPSHKVHPQIAWNFHSCFPKFLKRFKLGVLSPLNHKLPNQHVPGWITVPSETHGHFMFTSGQSPGSFEFLGIVGNVKSNKARLSAPGSLLAYVHRLAQLWFTSAESGLMFTPKLVFIFIWPALLTTLVPARK